MTNKKLKISVCVITYNEEKNIQKCLESVIDWVDEIVVVDAYSTDNTLKIVEKYTSKIYQSKWEGFSQQKNFCLSKAQHKWILFLDADEYVTKELKKRTFEIFEREPDCDFYKIQRKEHFMNKWIRYGAWNPSWHIRLFKKENAYFTGEVHEYPVVKGKGGYIDEFFYHQSFQNLEDLLDKFNSYTTLDAQKKFNLGVKHKKYYMFFSGMAMFFKSYIVKKGYRDGLEGLLLAIIEGMYFLIRQAKLYYLWQKNKNLER
ncbi:MAG: glycosyltransferase family 2 protein [Candidatus Edwardsbacteria bacterium]